MSRCLQAGRLACGGVGGILGLALLLLRIAAVPGVGSFIQRAGVGGALSSRGAGELQGGAPSALWLGGGGGSLVPVGPQRSLAWQL